MAEKCLMMTSLAILACHPSSTIRCFKPRPSVVSPKKENLSSENDEKPKPHESLDSHAKRVFSFPRIKEIRVPFELLEEVVEGEASLRVVEAVFRTGWKNGSGGYKIQKVFRVNHGKEVYKRFEEYREIVMKSRGVLWGDGNEVLRYRGTAITCSLGFDQFTSTCTRRSCGVCRIIGHNSNVAKEIMNMRPVTLSKTSWRAHRRAEKCRGGRDDNKRAIVVCRVIAGRIARCCNGNLVNGEEDGSFDSVEYVDSSEKLMVLDSRAILPCFVVLYKVFI